MDDSLSNCYEFMVETAYLAGRGVLAYYQTGVQPDFKPDDTPVTVADRRAEALIRGRIERRLAGLPSWGRSLARQTPGMPATAGSSIRSMGRNPSCRVCRCSRC